SGGILRPRSRSVTPGRSKRRAGLRLSGVRSISAGAHCPTTIPRRAAWISLLALVAYRRQRSAVARRASMASFLLGSRRLDCADVGQLAGSAGSQATATYSAGRRHAGGQRGLGSARMVRLGRFFAGANHDQTTAGLVARFVASAVGFARLAPPAAS